MQSKISKENCRYEICHIFGTTDYLNVYYSFPWAPTDYLIVILYNGAFCLQTEKIMQQIMLMFLK